MEFFQKVTYEPLIDFKTSEKKNHLWKLKILQKRFSSPKLSKHTITFFRDSAF